MGIGYVQNEFKNRTGHREAGGGRRDERGVERDLGKKDLDYEGLKDYRD